MTNINSCFECNSTKELVNHHVVPRILGGKRTIFLCPSCHGKVHNLKRTSHSSLTKRVLTKMRKRGLRISCRIPYGFDLAPDKKHLIKNKTEQQGITVMLSLRQDGLSFPQIARELDKRGIRTKVGNCWCQGTVNGIIKRQKTYPIN